MKKRVITGVLGLLLFFVIMFSYDTILFDIIVCAISLIAVHELLLALQCTKNIPLCVIALITAILPFIYANPLIGSNAMNIMLRLKPAIFFILIGGLFAVVLISHEKLKFTQVASAFFVSFVVSNAFSSMLIMRNGLGTASGVYFTLLIFACAWGSDTGAYFAGRFFGKHKLAPKISPNKTIEGLVGGVISCYLFVSLVTLGLGLYLWWFEGTVLSISLTQILLLILLATVGSLIGVGGDLCASAIKRDCGIKDFGSIFPGHGGVMDRFDSAVAIAPFFYIVLSAAGVLL